MTPPAGAFRVRSAAPADIVELAALELSAFAEPWSSSALAGFWEVPGARAWLAETADGEAVGFALFRIVPQALEAELLRIGTAAGWQRKGVAAHLLTLALAELDHQAIASFLEVRADNFAAQELYRRLGFTVTDRRRAYYRDGCDAWLCFRPPGARAG